MDTVLLEWMCCGNLYIDIIGVGGAEFDADVGEDIGEDSVLIFSIIHEKYQTFVFSNSALFLINRIL